MIKSNENFKSSALQNAYLLCISMLFVSRTKIYPASESPAQINFHIENVAEHIVNQ